MATQEKILTLITSHLQAEEQIIMHNEKPIMVEGQYETKILNKDTIRKGYLVTTNQRVIFYAKKFGGYDIESFPYVTISSFEGGKNMMGNHLKIITSGNTAMVKWIQDAGMFAILIETVQKQINNLKNKNTNISQAPSVAQEIEKIANLLKQDLISKEEYEKLKQKIINS
jgi:hypothetical protein